MFLEEKQLSELDLDGLDELEDSEDEAVILEYRQKRIAEMKRMSEKPRFGDVVEVSGQDYVQEVNRAGEGIWVIIHLYKQGCVIYLFYLFCFTNLNRVRPGWDKHGTANSGELMYLSDNQFEVR